MDVVSGPASLESRTTVLLADGRAYVVKDRVWEGDTLVRALAATGEMHKARADVNERWDTVGRPRFGLGVGFSTGEVAAALRGSKERLEYSIVGDVVNLARRLHQWTQAGETVLRETWAALDAPIDALALEPVLVKGEIP